MGDLDESSWQPDWIALEGQVLTLTNSARAKAGCCGDQGCFPASRALVLDPRLQRSARAHAEDMAERDYFRHDSPDGVTPFDRIRESGFRGCAMGENLATSDASPDAIIRGWLDSPEHCANIRNPEFDHLGVGYHPAPDPQFGQFWVQNFGG